MRQRFLLSLFMMLITPVGTLVYEMRKSGFEYRKWIVIAFVTLYGSVVTLTEAEDGYRHWQNVYSHYIGLPFDQFGNELLSIVTFDPSPETNDDVYLHVLSYFTAQVIGLPSMFFVFVSFVYAYFFVGSLAKVLQWIPSGRHGWLFYGFVLVFVLWKNVEAINTVRTWTGMWILFYAVISYLDSHKKKYLLLLFVPPLVHVGYFLMALPAWIVMTMGSRKIVYTLLYFVSFFTGIEQNVVITNLQQIELGKTKVQQYHVGLVDERLQKQQQAKRAQANWYTSLNKSGVQDIGINILALLLIVYGVYFSVMTRVESGLFSIGLLSKVAANYGSFLYALSNRSQVISGLFILAAFILMWKRGALIHSFQLTGLKKVLVYISFLLLVPFIVYKVADLIHFISAWLVVFPFVVWLDESLNTSLRDVIKFMIGG